MNRRVTPAFLEIPHIDPKVDLLIDAYQKLKDRKNEQSEFRFAEYRSELAKAFPFHNDGYDYVAVTDIDEALKDTVVKASPREMYKLAMRGKAPAMDDRNYTQFRPDVPEELKDFLKQFKGQVSRTRFATLKIRQTIYEHIDNDEYHTIRIHVPLITDKYSIFGVRTPNGVETMHMEVGKVYFLNTALPHWVMNGSRNVDRVHLVINLNSREDIDDLYPRD